MIQRSVISDLFLDENPCLKYIGIPRASINTYLRLNATGVAIIIVPHASKEGIKIEIESQCPPPIKKVYMPRSNNQNKDPESGKTIFFIMLISNPSLS